jgi:serine/threonine protein kinase
LPRQSPNAARADLVVCQIAHAPQQTIAHYKILGKIGEGAMGAAYRGIDTKLGREVAIRCCLTPSPAIATG